MKRLPNLAFYLIFCFTSCGQKNCEITNYHSLNWRIIDSTTSFFSCSNSDIKLSAKDSVEVEYLGILKSDENELVQRPPDESIFVLLTNVNFGKFKVSDKTLPLSIRNIVGKMTKKSVYTIKYDLSKIKTLKPDKKITVYFKEKVDSAMVDKWLSEIKRKPYVDSVKYLSEDAAVRNWFKNEDTAWKSLLARNPLPSSAEIFITEQYFDTAFIFKLKQEFLQLSIVSDAVYSDLFASDILKKIDEIFSNRYLIRVRTEE